MNLKFFLCTQAAAEVIRILDAIEADGTAADRSGFKFSYLAYEPSGKNFKNQHGG